MTKTTIKAFTGDDLYELTNIIQNYADDNNLNIIDISVTQQQRFYSLVVLFGTRYIYDL